MFLFAKLVMEHLVRIKKLFRLRQEIQWLKEGEGHSGVVEKLSMA